MLHSHYFLNRSFLLPEHYVIKTKRRRNSKQLRNHFGTHACIERLHRLSGHSKVQLSSWLYACFFFLEVKTNINNSV